MRKEYFALYICVFLFIFIFCLYFLSMKQFNSFAVNSQALSDYYSPKNSPQVIAFGNSKYNKDSLLKGSSNITENYFKSSTFNYNIQRNKTQHVNTQQQYNHITLQDFNEQNSSNNDDKFETNLSLMMSTVSLPQFNRGVVNQNTIFNLQNNITQHLLQLREEKIVLMQKLSKIIDNKNLFQYYLLKHTLQKEEEMETNLDSPIRYELDQVGQNHQEDYVPITISAPILKENEELHLRLKELQIKEQIFGSNIQEQVDNQKSQFLINEIVRVRELISNLQSQISSKHISRNENQQSRFVTFLPQDRQKHFQSAVKSPPNEEYKELQEKYNKLKLVHESHRYKLTVEEATYLQDLKNENKRLVDQVQRMISDKRRQKPQRILDLKRNIQQNQQQKQVFLQQLQKFKEVMRNAKNQNKRLKYQLNI